MKPLLPVLLFLGSSINASAFTVHLTVYSETCNGGDGAVVTTVTGGVPPYTYVWNNASIAESLMGLTAGSYSVTVTDNVGAQGSAACDVQQTGDFPLNFEPLFGTGGLAPCEGECNGGFRLHLLRVIGGYSLLTTPSMTYAELLPEDEPGGIDAWITYEFLGGCPGENVDVDVSLNAGCVASQGSIVIYQSETPTVTIQEITGSCTNGEDGSITVNLTGPFLFEELWSVQAMDDLGSVQGFDYFEGINQQMQFLDLHPGDYILHVASSLQSGSNQEQCVVNVPFVVPDLGAACGTLSGVVHFETDMDCLQDGSEVGIPYRMLRIEPGPMYGITGADGSYDVGVPYGSYTVEQTDPVAVQLCPVADPVPFSVSVGSLTATVDLADSLLTPFDMQVWLGNTIARPGFTFTYYVDLYNTNGHPGDNVILTLTYEQLFTFASASPGLSTSGPGQAQWDIGVLEPFAHLHFALTLQVPPDPLLIGTGHGAFASVTSTTTDVDAGNNSYSHAHIVQGSFDPNDKTAYTSSGLADGIYFMDVDEYVDYLIRFQNTGTDTAFNVAITDTISPLLDMGSLRIVGASHPFTPAILHGNVLQFSFNDILLPDSTSDEAASHGYVAFRMAPLPDLEIGELITNAADIYFDFNPPIRTNTAELITEITVGVPETSAPGLLLAPVPAGDLLNVLAPGHNLTGTEVLAMDGRVVARHAGNGVVDVSALKPGVYLLRARTTAGRELQARFVKR